MPPEAGRRLDRRHIGHTFETFTAEVQASRLRAFARATHQADPMFTDADVPLTAGFGALPAPPTFLFCLERDAPNPDSLLDLLGVDRRQRLLHAEQGFKYYRPVHAGDVLTFRQRLDDVFDKKDGALQFALRTTSVSNQNGEAMADMRHLLVLVHEEGELRSRNIPEPVVPEQGAMLPDIETPPISRHDIALYACASGDHNPVHVDIDFARDAGFDDVFVHGMFVMAQAARPLTAWEPMGLRELSIRFEHITHVGDRLRCRAYVGARDEHGRHHVDLQVHDQDGVRKATGRAMVAAV